MQDKSDYEVINVKICIKLPISYFCNNLQRKIHSDSFFEHQFLTRLNIGNQNKPLFFIVTPETRVFIVKCFWLILHELCFDHVRE